MKAIENALDLLGAYAQKHKCGIQTLTDARAELAELKRKLQEIEFLPYQCDEAIDYCCPACGNNEGEGHAENCWLKRFIREV